MKKFIVCFLMSFLTLYSVCGADYQWSVLAPKMLEEKGHPMAYMWIPPRCQQVRGIVLSQDKVTGCTIFNSPIFRQAMADLDFALIWTDGKWEGTFPFDKGAGTCVTELLDSLAEVSGYQEIAYVPIVPIGYSWHASYPWNFAAWNPERTLAILSIHGDAPLSNLTGSGRPNPEWGNRNIDGIPGLQVMGELEFTEDRLAPALAFQKKYPNAVITVLCEVGMSHHSFTDDMISFLALYLRKVAIARLPKSMPLDKEVSLKRIKKEEGWLIERWHRWELPRTDAAPYAVYEGDREDAFWCMDEEMARAIEHFSDRRRKTQLIGYVQNGKVVGESPGTMQQSTLALQPLDDGESFTLTPVFLSKVPSGNPEWWSNKKAGDKIGHALGGGPIQFSPFSLELYESEPGIWKLNFHRGYPATDVSGTSTLWFLANHFGDEEYRSTVGPGAITEFPICNKKGKVQQILFPPIPDLTSDVPYISLKAESTIGLKVHYYVLFGPAEVVGDKLKFTAIPPRARYPLKVTVVAWQYGRLVDPMIQTATPVIRSFYIHKRAR